MQNQDMTTRAAIGGLWIDFDCLVFVNACYT